MESKQKVRSEEIRVKFTPEMKSRVDRIAQLHGQPSATWCNHAIAKAVVDFERHMQLQNKAQESLLDQLMDFFGPQLSDTLHSSQVAADAAAGCRPLQGPKADGDE